MRRCRKPTNEEIQIIGFLVKKANYTQHGWQKNLMVANMNDGMGSLLLIPEKQKNDERLFEAQISEAIFKDSDGIDVLLSLNIDKEGYLFELDVWKVNYEKVISYANMVKLIKNQ